MSSPLDSLRMLLEVDRVIHEPSRLVVMVYLSLVDSADFVFLQRETGLTGGNLTSHLAKLEGAGFITVEKGFVGKKPQTRIQLTDKGRKALQSYLTALEQGLGMRVAVE